MLDSDPLLDVRQVSRRFAVPRTTVYSWAASGRLPHYKLGQLLRFREEDIAAFLERSRRGEAVSEFVRRSRVAQGLPERVEDPGALESVAILVAGSDPDAGESRPQGEAVVESAGEGGDPT